LGILLEAKSNGLIKDIKPYLDMLRQQAGFYIRETLYRQMLIVAGE
jgi:predicted nucleic acid-binding protein